MDDNGYRVPRTDGCSSNNGWGPSDRHDDDVFGGSTTRAVLGASNDLHYSTFVTDQKKRADSSLNKFWKGINRLYFKPISMIRNKKLAKIQYEPAPAVHTLENFDEFEPVPNITWYRETVNTSCGMLASSRLNLLLVFVPIGLACYFVETTPLASFIVNGIAIVPLSSLLTDATERIAAHSGDSLGALLNITLGNIVELILFVALADNQFRVVQASLLGSVLVNLMLILGSALLAASASKSLTLYNTTEAQLLACLLFVSVFTFIMPSAFDRAFGNNAETARVVLKMTRLSSLLILCIYVVYFIYEIRHNKAPSEDEYTRAQSDVERNQHSEPRRGLGAGYRTNSIVLPPRTIRFADEDSADLAEESATQQADRFELGSATTKADDEGTDDEEQDSSVGHGRGRRLSSGSETSRSTSGYHQASMQPRAHSRSISLTSSIRPLSRDSSISGERTFARSGLASLHLIRNNRLQHDYDHDQPPRRISSRVELLISLFVLVIASVLMSMNADLLVSTIDEVTQQIGLSKAFIGLIILPIVGNISEYVTVVAVAVNDKLDLAIAVAVGSSIQIALCVAPLVVIAGWALKVDFALTFNVFEMVILFGTVLLVNLLVLNNTSSVLETSGLKGALMCVCYCIIGLGAFFAPEET
ncbi:hypothetical protein QQS21_007926 [Conoideocrella luteorostrata]|uniref:Sodium/calcium exchanger membrane region domain-containing protein n=1 Tax=Conoideocrella luteorostrata TaxID=1105319 RepID=A0AAJ0CP71_9HYPO|nr:hypothetical protein QQS21_007926 [Conoideocrella luteorostrata]